MSSNDSDRTSVVGPGFVEDRHRAAVALIDRAGRHPAAAGNQRPARAASRPRPAAQVHPDELLGAVRASGYLQVPGVLDPETATSLVRDLDRAFAASDAWFDDRDGPSGPWFTPYAPDELAVHMTRPAVRAQGGIFTADSPQLFARWLGVVRESGLFDLIAQCFGETPVTSLTKGTLRRVRAGDGIEWHQDGAFLGVDSGALNVWVSLSDTAGAPGLEVVDRRFDEIVPTGTHGATYDWSVGDDLVDELAPQATVVSPSMAAGDALIFDGLLLHRTARTTPPLPGTRYAIETWFFRPSNFPDHQFAPLAI